MRPVSWNIFHITFFNIMQYHPFANAFLSGCTLFQCHVLEIQGRNYETIINKLINRIADFSKNIKRKYCHLCYFFVSYLIYFSLIYFPAIVALTSSVLRTSLTDSSLHGITAPAVNIYCRALSLLIFK